MNARQVLDTINDALKTNRAATERFIRSGLAGVDVFTFSGMGPWFTLDGNGTLGFGAIIDGELHEGCLDDQSGQLECRRRLEIRGGSRSV